MRWRVLVLVYLVLFVGELSWQAVTPLPQEATVSPSSTPSAHR